MTSFKRLKERQKLEDVSGLSQQALIIDVAAKVLADNITALMCTARAEHDDLLARSQKCNQSYAATYMQRVLSRLVLLLGNLVAAIDHTVAMLGPNSQHIVPGRSQLRRPNDVKPHPSCSRKA